MAGMRPIVDIMFGDFMTIIMDQLVNQAAKIHYMSGGRWKVPMVVRCTMGATRRSAAQHSQSLHAWPSHVPGLKVVVPSTPYDAKGLFKAAVRDDNPVVIFEHKISYRKVKGPVPDDDYIVPLGVADVKREGSDITLVALSSMVQVALGAAQMLEEVGISAEVVDPRTTWPLDEKALIESAKKTSRCIVIDEGYGRYGVTGELASVIQEGAFYYLDAPVRRLGAMHVPIPFSPSLRTSPCRPRARCSKWRGSCATSSGRTALPRGDARPHFGFVTGAEPWQSRHTARWLWTGSAESISIGCAANGLPGSRACWLRRRWARCSAST
jgi:pyruvate dehydrogenase E1 component beta subunit